MPAVPVQELALSLRSELPFSPLEGEMAGRTASALPFRDFLSDGIA